VRAVDPARAQVDGRAVLLPVHEDAAGGGGAAARLPHRAEDRDARQHLADGDSVHLDEPADRGVDDAVVPRRGAGRDAGGRGDGRRRPGDHLPARHHPADVAGHRRDRADLLHLQLERDAVRPRADRCRVADRAGVPHRLRDQPGPVPRQGVRRGVRGVVAGAGRGVRRPGPAGAGPVPGRGQVTALSMATLPDLPPEVLRPTYDRRALRTGIVHVGVGGFHRAHQAVTEGGYNFNAVTGEFDANLPDVVADLAPDAVPRTTFGLVTGALARRRARGVPPFTVMSCDNIQGNGDAARRSFVAFARLR